MSVIGVGLEVDAIFLSVPIAQSMGTALRRNAALVLKASGER